MDLTVKIGRAPASWQDQFILQMYAKHTDYIVDNGLVEIGLTKEEVIYLANTLLKAV